MWASKGRKLRSAPSHGAAKEPVGLIQLNDWTRFGPSARLSSSKLGRHENVDCIAVRTWMMRTSVLMLVVLLGQSVGATLCLVGCAFPAHHDGSRGCRDAAPLSDSSRALTASDSACDHTVTIIATVENQQGVRAAAGPTAVVCLNPGLTPAVHIAFATDRQFPPGRVHQAFPLRI